MGMILGIETSCDETAAAVVADGREVRSNLIATQYDLHAKYGGVVPELASRAHLEQLDALIREALAAAGVTPADLDGIAVTARPGLIGCLLIGVTAAKALAWAWGKPLIGVDHLEAHATSAAILPDHDPWPAVSLVVSGGHTSLFRVEDVERITLLGATVDDAAGEAFDKVASILKLGYPGGPVVDRRARLGDPERVRFPRSMPGDGLDFSFSGLKTAVLYHVHGPGRTFGGLERISEQDVNDVCAAFSAAAVDVLVDRSMQALERTGLRTLLVGGGVAANSMLRVRLEQRCRERGVTLHVTPPAYCTDNAAMIAALGHRLLKRGRRDDFRLTASARRD
ncbi:MAG: tRNA N6-adenosine threonylcarbamoyltransferase [Phycisphaerae bacterium]|nr:MAG: tRNA (adenosine(37)-N6)-threonylcarbamoyltransferase complex transferase subunit TsaD [Planctomycetia bacterium]GJQ26673.1 MAG: tRNA N6-adenosine threonylcarbamoyltransferase [Phycisphaerae bacterium]